MGGWGVGVHQQKPCSNDGMGHDQTLFLSSLLSKFVAVFLVVQSVITTLPIAGVTVPVEGTHWREESSHLKCSAPSLQSRFWNTLVQKCFETYLSHVTCICVLSMCVGVYLCVSVYMYLCKSVCVCINVCIRVCVYLCICMCVHLCVYLFVVVPREGRQEIQKATVLFRTFILPVQRSSFPPQPKPRTTPRHLLTSSKQIFPVFL